LEIPDHWHGNQCCPNLYVEGIFAGANEGLHLQILLQGLKEKLYLPKVSPEKSNIMNESVITEVVHGLGVITLNRPETLNSINLSMAKALRAAIGQIASDGSVRALLIQGAGKHFCVGGDVKWFAEKGGNLSEGLDAILLELNPFVFDLINLRIPIITAVHGHVAGAGVGIALAGDFVLASESFKMLSSYSAIGLSPDAGSVHSLVRRIGSARTKTFFFQNRPLDAVQCMNWGIVNSIHPDERLASNAQELAQKLAQGPTQALILTKKLIDQAGKRNIEEQLALEREFMARCGRSNDGQEGVRAFIEKRKPLFQGH